MTRSHGRPILQNLTHTTDSGAVEKQGSGEESDIAGVWRYVAVPRWMPEEWD